jgi:hypothetical protein
MKFDRFANLSDQIVAAQAHAEKLRARDGPHPTSDLEKALHRVSYVLYLKILDFIVATRLAIPMQKERIC